VRRTPMKGAFPELWAMVFPSPHRPLSNESLLHYHVYRPTGNPCNGVVLTYTAVTVEGDALRPLFFRTRHGANKAAPNCVHWGFKPRVWQCRSVECVNTKRCC
jgi:hypothetical protein